MLGLSSSFQTDDAGSYHNTTVFNLLSVHKPSSWTNKFHHSFIVQVLCFQLIDGEKFSSINSRFSCRPDENSNFQRIKRKTEFILLIAHKTSAETGNLTLARWQPETVAETSDIRSQWKFNEMPLGRDMFHSEDKAEFHLNVLDSIRVIERVSDEDAQIEAWRQFSWKSFS